MKASIIDIIRKIIGKYEEEYGYLMIWGYDISKLNSADHTDIKKLFSNGKLLFDSDFPAPAPGELERSYYNENGEHRDLKKGVFISDPVFGLRSHGVYSLERTLELDSLELKAYDEVLEIGDDCPPRIYHHSGLYSEALGISLSEFACKLTYLPDILPPTAINGEALSAEETEYVFTIVFYLLSVFDTSGLYDLIFFQYLFYIMSDRKAYDKPCFENMFLITFSEAPMTAEAVQAVKYDSGIRLTKRDILISDAFEAAVFCDEAAAYLAECFSAEREDIFKLLRDIMKILRCFEI
ncbi:MAG: hypothetical protein ACI4XF_06070 [Oscillospiraceae bacterium]